MLWQGIAIGTLAAACVQNWLLANRLADATTRCWKFGLQSGLISAGIPALVVFGGATAALVAIGIVAADRLATRKSPFRFCSLVAVQMLLAGALVWLGFVSSPVVAFAN